MEKMNWRNIAEFTGIAAIIGSLLFVGLQLKQSQEIAVANQYHARYVSANDYIGNVLQSDVAMRVFGQRALARIQESNAVPDSVKDWAANQPVDELAFWFLEGFRHNKAHDNNYYQYQAGFLSQEAWDGFRAEIKRDYSSDSRGIRSYYLMAPEIWRLSYREMVNEIIVEIGSESD